MSNKSLIDSLKSKPNKPTHNTRMPKCKYMGCPLKASSQINGEWACSFHDSPDYHQSVTEAINKRLSLITAYSKMLKWTSSDWESNHAWLKTNQHIQLQEDECRSIYLQRYYMWIIDTVKTEATELI